MGKKRRPPHSVSAEDIDRDLAEMRHSPITRPNLSFLVPSRNATLENKTSPDDIAGAISSGDSLSADAAPSAAATKPAPILSTPDVLAAAETASHATASVGSRPRPLHYCLTARDGHSPTEHLIYSVMWTLGRPEGPPENAPRLIQMSQPELARRVGITERNLRIAIVRLIEKLALEEVADFTKDTKAPRVYRVFSEDDILRRRQQAGLLWVVRRKGVQFVSPGEGIPRSIYTTPVVLSPDLTTATFSATTQPFPASILSAFREYGLPLSPAIAARLWLECRRRVPDCTPEEVGALLSLALADLRSTHSGDQILEHLLVKWAHLVDPANFTTFREARNRSREKLRQIDEENRRYWESVAADREAHEADRELARKILETL